MSDKSLLLLTLLLTVAAAFARPSPEISGGASERASSNEENEEQKICISFKENSIAEVTNMKNELPTYLMLRLSDNSKPKLVHYKVLNLVGSGVGNFPEEKKSSETATRSSDGDEDSHSPLMSKISSSDEMHARESESGLEKTIGTFEPISSLSSTTLPLSTVVDAGTTTTIDWTTGDDDNMTVINNEFQISNDSLLHGSEEGSVQGDVNDTPENLSDTTTSVNHSEEGISNVTGNLNQQSSVGSEDMADEQENHKDDVNEAISPQNDTTTSNYVDDQSTPSPLNLLSTTNIVNVEAQELRLIDGTEISTTPSTENLLNTTNIVNVEAQELRLIDGTEISTTPSTENLLNTTNIGNLEAQELRLIDGAEMSTMTDSNITNARQGVFLLGTTVGMTDATTAAGSDNITTTVKNSWVDEDFTTEYENLVNSTEHSGMYRTSIDFRELPSEELTAGATTEESGISDTINGIHTTSFHTTGTVSFNDTIPGHISSDSEDIQRELSIENSNSTTPDAQNSRVFSEDEGSTITNDLTQPISRDSTQPISMTTSWSELVDKVMSVEDLKNRTLQNITGDEEFNKSSSDSTVGPTQPARLPNEVIVSESGELLRVLSDEDTTTQQSATGEELSSSENGGEVLEAQDHAEELPITGASDGEKIQRGLDVQNSTEQSAFVDNRNETSKAIAGGQMSDVTHSTEPTVVILSASGELKGVISVEDLALDPSDNITTERGITSLNEVNGISVDTSSILPLEMSSTNSEHQLAGGTTNQQEIGSVFENSEERLIDGSTSRTKPEAVQGLQETTVAGGVTSSEDGDPAEFGTTSYYNVTENIFHGESSTLKNDALSNSAELFRGEQIGLVTNIQEGTTENVSSAVSGDVGDNVISTEPAVTSSDKEIDMKQFGNSEPSTTTTSKDDFRWIAVSEGDSKSSNTPQQTTPAFRTSPVDLISPSSASDKSYTLNPPRKMEDWEKFINFTITFPPPRMNRLTIEYPIMGSNYQPVSYFKRHNVASGQIQIIHLPPARNV